MEVRHDAARSRFELVDDGAVIGIADYRRREDGSVVLPHTVIDPDRRGQGLGDVLVAGALEQIHGWGAPVVAQCWFVADHLRRHPR